MPRIRVGGGGGRGGSRGGSHGGNPGGNHGGEGGDSGAGDSIAELFKDNPAIVIALIVITLLIVVVVAVVRAQSSGAAEKAAKRRDKRKEADDAEGEEETTTAKKKDKAAEDSEQLDPDDDPRQHDGPVDGPPDEEFWEKYNRRLEFPLATVAAVFIHVVVGAILIYLLVGLLDKDEDKSGPDLKLMQVGGLDDSGEGSAGSGGQADPDIVRDVDPYKSAKEVLPTTQSINDAKENIQKIVLPDTTGTLPIATPNAASYSQLDKTIRDKLLGVGAQRGEGDQPGKGFDGTPGKGPGGTGSDSTRARGLRWVLRFSVRSGSDYITQLRAMGAEILIPLTSDKDCLVIQNLDNPSARVATDADFKRLAGKIQFSDNRQKMVREVIDSLGVGGSVRGDPKAFWAFFPKDLEEELARKETSYRNRRAEDIEETVFRITIRGGAYEILVEDQVRKK